MTTTNLIDALIATGRAMERRTAAPLPLPGATKLKLGRAELAVLRRLSDVDCLRLTELAGHFGCTIQNASQIVRRLATAGLVEIVMFRRRRQWRAARITDRGREAIGRASAEASASGGDVLSVLSEDERALLLDLLTKLLEGVPGPSRTVRIDPEEVARRTPPPAPCGPARDEALRARAAQIDPRTLPPYELCVWEWERDGLRAPEHMYVVLELMRDAAKAKAKAKAGEA